MELHPTGDVSEYSATVTYELLMEGEEGNQKVDTVKMVLKAEGITFIPKIFQAKLQNIIQYFLQPNFFVSCGG